MTETAEKKERYIEIAVSRAEDRADTEESLSELSRLLETAGGECVYKVIQQLERPVAATYIGSGKIEELRSFIDAFEADGVISDDELTPAQLGNLEAELHVKVIDRTMLILDIFARHAVSREGKIQVEMAQLSYKSSRLSGSAGKAMSRLGGGIGTRGPGETKLETDRRRIRNRIASLRKELRVMKKNRENTRKAREKNGLPVFAIVGYTNAGKSTLLNALTGSDVLSEDALFATLDPTTRRLELENGLTVLLTDTVGFISKLPHDLIDAFHSTLEEAGYADYIIHVVDSSDQRAEKNMQVVKETLSELGISGKPIITVFNKSDKGGGPRPLSDRVADITLRASARTGEGLDTLRDAIKRVVTEDMELVSRVFSYTQVADLERLRDRGRIVKEDYQEDGIHVEALIRK
ncbi:GTPase HflX [Candidatus Weimeria sp. HCP3S3_B5]|uniref:GTPase HflX n=1 Tax=Candidatus Weimeria sp. HCP3S3_B5 TaxID=3438871 RepID=UPI003F8BBA89